MSALLEVSGVSVTFDGFRAINNLSFSIGAQELRAIIGPNGAGKTTFMDIVTGKTRPDTGSVTFGERSVSLLSLSEAQIARAGVGRKFQRPTVFEDQTVAENLTMALKAHRAPWRVLFWKERPEDCTRVEALAQEVGLADHLPRKAGELSHGQKQWLEIGMLLVQKAHLLLLDEPVAGMSQAEREQTAILLRALAPRHTVVVVEHDMEFMRQVADSVSVLARGELIAEGSVADIQANPLVQEVYLGTPTTEGGR